jgi:hypothetical protein
VNSVKKPSIFTLSRHNIDPDCSTAALLYVTHTHTQRERDREGETDKTDKTDRQTDRQTDRERHTQQHTLTGVYAPFASSSHGRQFSMAWSSGLTYTRRQLVT